MIYNYYVDALYIEHDNILMVGPMKDKETMRVSG